MHAITHMLPFKYIFFLSLLTKLLTAWFLFLAEEIQNSLKIIIIILVV